MSGKAKLNYLQLYFGNSDSQGSTNWLIARKNRFGGSEVYRALHGKIKDIIQDKSNLKDKNEMNMNINCAFGHTFEIVAKYYLNIVKGHNIHEFGAIPCANLPIAYSPDGIILNEITDDLILLEIKCPIFRNPVNNKPIKEEYLYQIQTGMFILPCDHTAFIEFKFRKCSREQITTTKFQKSFDREFHNKDFSKNPDGYLWFGYLWWNQPGLLHEDFDTKPPTLFKCSFNSDCISEAKELNNGKIMWFKCFKILTRNVPKNEKFQKNIKSALWSQFDKLNSSSSTITTEQIEN